MSKLPARIGDLGACLALGVLALVCFARLVADPTGLIVDGDRPSLDHMMPAGSRGVGNDVTFLFLPHYQAITKELDKSGRLPSWDASGFAGRPMVGNPQGGLFYPPVWAAWWFRAPSALGWLTFAHVIWGGIGAYVLARGFGIGRLGALVAGGCFEAAPYLLAHVFEGHYPHVWAVCWYPWAFAAFQAHTNGLRRGTLALPPVLALVFVAGHPQEWYYLALTLSAWAVIDAVRAAQRLGIGAGVVKLGVWGILSALSLGLAAVEAVPGRAAQAWMLRGSSLTIGQATRYDPHSVNLLQLLCPFALGGPSDYFGDDNYWEQLLSIGLVPLALATIAAWRHPNRRLVHGLLALTLVALVFALGRKLGLFIVCFKLVPGMRLFRTPSRALFVVQVGASVLAGLGIEALRANPRTSAPVSWPNFRRCFLGTSGLLLCGLVVAQWLCWSSDPFELARPELKREFEEGDPVSKTQKALPPKRRPRGPRHVAYEPPKIDPDVGAQAASRILHHGVFWVALGGTLVGVAVAGRAAGPRRWAAIGLGALALIELGVYGQTLLRVSPASRFLENDPVSRTLAAAGATVPQPFRVRVCDAFYDDLHASIHGFEKININDWYQIQRSADLYQTLYPLFDRMPPTPADNTMDQTLRDFGSDIRRGVLDRLNVGLLVADDISQADPWPIVGTGTWRGRSFAVHRNPSAVPRAYVVPRAYPTPDFLSRELGLMRAIDAREAVLMERDPLGRVGRRQPFTPAEYNARDSDHVVIRVTTDAPGLLVVADTWMPGWTAQLDGKAVPILRGNHAQRVVPLVEAGRHEVVMTYKAPGFFVGLVMTTASASFWAVALALTLRAHKRQRAPREQAPVRRTEIPRPHLRVDAGAPVSRITFTPSRAACATTTRASTAR